MERYPNRLAELMVTGEPACSNAKVSSLEAMARHSILVVSDSDIRADSKCLQAIAAAFSDPEVGVVTCPYRAVPGPSFWSILEALTVNSEFWCGVLVARLVEGMRFAVGPTMALRRQYLERSGASPRPGIIWPRTIFWAAGPSATAIRQPSPTRWWITLSAVPGSEPMGSTG